MIEDRPLEGYPLGHRGPHVVGREVVHQVVFHQHGGDGETPDKVAGKGKDRVVEEILDLVPASQVLEIDAGESAHGKPFQAGGEEKQQKGAEDVAGNRVAHENDDRGAVVEERAVADRFDDPEGDADRVGDDEGEDAVENGDGEPRTDDAPDRLVVAVAVAEVAGHDLADPVEVTDQDRLVETVVFLKLLDLVLGEGLVLAADGRCPPALGIEHLRLHQGTLQRPPRDEPGNDENQNGHTKEGGRKENETPEKIIAHS